MVPCRVHRKMCCSLNAEIDTISLNFEAKTRSESQMLPMAVQRFIRDLDSKYCRML